MHPIRQASKVSFDVPGDRALVDSALQWVVATDDDDTVAPVLLHLGNIAPRWPGVGLFLAALLEERGEFARGLEALEADPNAAVPLTREAYALTRGLLLMGLERYDDALRAFSECRSPAPRLQAGPEMAATLYLLGRHAEAIQRCTELIAETPEMAELYLLRARAQLDALEAGGTGALQRVVRDLDEAMRRSQGVDEVFNDALQLRAKLAQISVEVRAEQKFPGIAERLRAFFKGTIDS